MDEILGKLSAVIEELEGKTVTVTLKAQGSESIALIETLTEGKVLLKRARACFRQSQSLLQKGYGKLVEPEEE